MTEGHFGDRCWGNRQQTSCIAFRSFSILWNSTCRLINFHIAAQMGTRGSQHSAANSTFLKCVRNIMRFNQTLKDLGQEEASFKHSFSVDLQFLISLIWIWAASVEGLASRSSGVSAGRYWSSVLEQADYRICLRLCKDSTSALNSQRFVLSPTPQIKFPRY